MPTSGSDESIRVHDLGADEYDRQVEAYESHGHDLLFGLSYEFTRPGQRLVDVGIGTGLASLAFARTGLEVFGLDGSPEMLRVCRAKGFARELRCQNLQATPWPYPDCAFNLAICCGVLHFFGDLDPLAGEVVRILAGDGVFAFTATLPDREQTGVAVQPWVERDTPWGVAIFVHSGRSGAGWRSMATLADGCSLAALDTFQRASA